MWLFPHILEWVGAVGRAPPYLEWMFWVTESCISSLLQPWLLWEWKRGKKNWKWVKTQSSPALFCMSVLKWDTHAVSEQQNKKNTWTCSKRYIWFLKNWGEKNRKFRIQISRLCLFAPFSITRLQCLMFHVFSFVCSLLREKVTVTWSVHSCLHGSHSWRAHWLCNHQHPSLRLTRYLLIPSHLPLH